MNADNIKFHPHYSGELLTEAKETKTVHKKHGIEISSQRFYKYLNAGEIEGLTTDKVGTGETLSDTCKKRLTKVFVYEKYGRTDDLENRYIKKGLRTEEDCITLYSRLKKKVFFKNEQILSNDFLIGTPDLGDNKEILKSKVIIDTKSCWDLNTFWSAKTDSKVNPHYYWQIQCYLALTGAEKGIIAYCLIDTPHELIFDEKRRLQYKMGVISDSDKNYIDACAEIDRNMTYNDIPMSERMFEIEIPRNDEDIERIYARVKQCREYMNQHFFANETLTEQLLKSVA